MYSIVAVHSYFRLKMCLVLLAYIPRVLFSLVPILVSKLVDFNKIIRIHGERLLVGVFIFNLGNYAKLDINVFIVMYSIVAVHFYVVCQVDSCVVVFRRTFGGVKFFLLQLL